MARLIGQIVASVLLIALGSGAIVSAESPQATRYVRPTGDNGGGFSPCTDSTNPCATLNQALQASNDGDTIFIAGNYADVAVSISKSVTIVGKSSFSFPSPWGDCGGITCPTFTPLNNSHAFSINVAATETVTLRDFNVTGGTGLSAMRVNDGNAVVEGCTFEDNNAASGGGAIFVPPGTTLTVRNCRFEDNSSQTTGGAIGSNGVSDISDSVFLINSAEDSGGAINVGSASGDLTVTNSTFQQNVTGGFGGAINVNSGHVSIASSDFFTNTSAASGGAVAISFTDQAVITGGLMEANSVESDDFSVYGGAVNIIDSTVTVNGTTMRSNSSVAPNDTSHGGGISARQGSDVTVRNATLTANSAILAGVYLHDSDLTLIDSTISEHGRAIYSETFAGSGQMTVRGSTLSNNTQGITLRDVSGLDIANSTILTDNESFATAINTLSDGAVTAQYVTLVSPNGKALTINISNFGGSVSVENSILSGGCGQAPLFSWDSATIYDDDSCDNPNSLQVADVGLAQLGDYGGPTLTMYPLSTSPVLERGDPVDCQTAIDGEDQRGIGRPIGGRCDVGAVENNGLPLAIQLAQTDTNSFELTRFLILLLSLLFVTGWVISAEKQQRYHT